MAKGPWSRGTILRYTLLQLPAAALLGVVLLLLSRWLALPGWLGWALIGLWLAKDALLYPLVWKAYDPESPSPYGSLVGKTGIARDRLDSEGYVEIQGELWQAVLGEGAEAVEAGGRVEVVAIRNLTLIVRSAESSLRSS